MSGPDSAERQALAELGLGEDSGGSSLFRARSPLSRRETPLARPVDAEAKLQPFSWGWTLASIVVFAVFQLGFGWAAGKWLFIGPYLTENMRFFVEGAINLLSYFLSGLLIGVVSPRVRLLEPALGAAIVVVATLSVGLFTPNRLLAMGPLKLAFGGALAFGLALWGATLGERFTRQI